MLYCNNDFDTVQRCANHHSLVAVGPVSSCCSWAVTFALEAKRSDLRRLPMVSHAQKCHPTFFIFSEKNMLQWCNLVTSDILTHTYLGVQLWQNQHLGNFNILQYTFFFVSCTFFYLRCDTLLRTQKRSMSIFAKFAPKRPRKRPYFSARRQI